MENAQKILVVDDAKEIRELLRIILSEAGYEVVLAQDGIEALEKFDDSIHLVLLDVMMPFCDGIDACMQIRKQAEVPILFLTSKSDESDLIEGFEAGADDYLVKPFSCTELMLRVKALLRRSRTIDKKTVEEPMSKIYVADLVVDPEIEQVLRNGEELPLTEMEYRIMYLLASHRNRIFTAREIYEKVWGTKFMSNSANTVMVHIRNIRRKLGDTSAEAKYIHNIWGRGYRLLHDVESEE
ncbi:MAG: response regulator transcription factor [Lachnospiraceae bacterium]|nr:response regulator transcription factor [Lachnospiraceae bacterium]